MKLEELTLWRRSSSSRCRSSSSCHQKHVRSPSASSMHMLPLSTSSHTIHMHMHMDRSVSTRSLRDSTDDSRGGYNNHNVVAVSSRSSSPFSKTLAALLRSLISIVTLPIAIKTAPIPTTCRWLALPSSSTQSSSPSLGRKVTGTLFGHRKGHVTFAVQDHPRADPVLLIELPTSTSALVKEMSSGLVRIALECPKLQSSSTVRLYSEPVWTMYCNGSKCGYALSRACSELDLHVLRTVQSVSVGAGVIPQLLLDHGKSESESEGELLYMRGRFERVVGTRHSEAFYMLNPDGNGGPELSIFLLRL